MPVGVEVNTRTAPPSRAAPTDTDTLFVANPWSAGPTDQAVLVTSMVEVEANFGPRTGNTAIWDYLDTFFREGGRRAYLVRYTIGAGALATALTLFGPELGSGQVVAPAETPNATNYGVLATHAFNYNRFALLDVANNDTVNAMTTLGAAAAGITTPEAVGLFGPWVNVPAPAGVSGGSARQVPASAVVAGLIARADFLGNPNRAAAGRDFPLQYATSFVRDISSVDRETLLNGGVNTFANKYGVLQLYGFQTPVPQTQADVNPFWQINASRTRMWLKARAMIAGENYMFKPIDGRGKLATALKGELEGICLELYNAGGLYGDTSQDAFQVTVNAIINTVGTIAQGELHAVLEARYSLHAKRVIIDLISIPVSGLPSS